jgi:hypothetical protein
MPLVAHVLPSNVVPLAMQWMAIGMTAAGGVGILRRRHALLDTLSWSTFCVGALGCLTMVSVAMLSPPPPPYTLSLVVSQQTTSPVQVTVCARKADGSPAATPDGDHVLGVLIDGVQVANQSTGQFPVPMARGRHALRIELLTRDHREFNPTILVDTAVTVKGDAALTTWKPCPR